MLDNLIYPDFTLPNKLCLNTNRLLQLSFNSLQTVMTYFSLRFFFCLVMPEWYNIKITFFKQQPLFSLSWTNQRLKSQQLLWSAVVDIVNIESFSMRWSNTSSKQICNCRRIVHWYIRRILSQKLHGRD